MPDLKDTIEQNAQGPRQVTGDEGAVQQHSLREQIEAAKFLAEQTSRGKRKLPIRLAKIRPGGAI